MKTARVRRRTGLWLNGMFFLIATIYAIINICFNNVLESHDTSSNSQKFVNTTTEPAVYSEWVSVCLRSKKNCYAKNEDIVIDYVIENDTKNLTLEISELFAPDSTVEFKIIDLTSGSELRSKAEDEGLPKGYGACETRHVSPGGEYKGRYKISEYFDMTKSGVYEIYAQKSIICFIEAIDNSPARIIKSSNHLYVKVK